MHNTKILFALAALTGPSLSQKSDSEFCSAFFTSFLSVILNSDVQTPTAIVSFLAQQTPTATTTTAPLTTLDFASHAQELCELATELPPSLLPEFSTYAAGLLSFGLAYSSEHVAYVTDCAPETEVASRSSYLEYVFSATGDFCTQTPAPGGASNGTYPTPTPTPTLTATSYLPSSNVSTTPVVTAAAAAAWPSGACLGAAAVGGILGAAALI